MADKEKPEQTPREMIAKLDAMTDEEFGQFMHGHFNRICKKPPPESNITPSITYGSAKDEQQG